MSVQRHPRIVLRVVESLQQPGLLSLRLDGSPRSGTAMKRALINAGFRSGDVCELTLVLDAPEKRDDQ